MFSSVDMNCLPPASPSGPKLDKARLPLRQHTMDRHRPSRSADNPSPLAGAVRHTHPMQQPDSTVAAPTAHPNGHGDRYPTVTLAEYAALTGQSVRTVREKARHGLIPAELVKGRHGFEYRVRHPDSTLPEGCAQPNNTPPAGFQHADSQPSDTVTAEYGYPSSQGAEGIDSLVTLVRDLNQQVMELSGRLGWMSKELQLERERSRDLEQQVKQLAAAPAEPTNQAPLEMANRSAEPANGHDSAFYERESRPWWRRLLHW